MKFMNIQLAIMAGNLKSGFNLSSAGLGTDSNLISATRASGHTAIGGGTQKDLGR
jgi:hypothetical protein